MKTFLHTLLCILLICALIIGVPLCMSGCSSENSGSDTKPVIQERFVEVDESLICPDYVLGIDGCLSDGSMQSDVNYYRYLVDRYSKRVYIEIRETGQHSSGVVWIECLDKEGNHMVYTGELDS